MNWFWFAFASAVLISIETILEKKILKKEHAMQFSTILAISVAVISLIFLPYLNFDNINIDSIIIIYLNSWLATISFLLVSKAIRHMEVSLVSPLLSFGPIFILIFSLIILKEKITNFHLLGIFLVMFGSYILKSKESDFFAPIKEIIKSKYIHYIFIALALNGVTATLDRYFLKDAVNIDPISYFFLISMFLAINYSILISILHKGLKDINKGFEVSGIIIIILAILVILSRIFLYQAFSQVSAFLAEPVKRISVLFVILFGGPLYHEKQIFKKFIASLIMLGGIYIITT